MSAYDNSEKPSSTNSEWMRSIDNKTLLNDLSIPGTHNTLARYGVGSLGVCQTWSLADQLNGGIRYLDIRIRHFNDTLPIHHEQLYQHESLSSALKDCVSFLSAHKSETILLYLQREYKAENNQKTLEELVMFFLNEHKGYVWEGKSRRSIPTLGEVRGQIVVITDIPLSVGLQKSYCLREDSEAWYIGAFESYKSFYERKKKHLKSKGDTFNRVAFSGTSYFLPTPSQIASNINPMFLSDLSSFSFVGTVLFDFPGAKLINSIIALN